MSAYIVGQAHIDVLVQGLCESEHVTDLDPDQVGRALWAENLASVAYRYPGDGDGDRPGPIGFRDDEVDAYTYRRPTRRIDRVGLLVALAGYTYQSCEHPSWKSSDAHRWTAQLTAALTRAGVLMPPSGARLEAWDYEEEDVHQPAAQVAR